MLCKRPHWAGEVVRQGSLAGRRERTVAVSVTRVKGPDDRETLPPVSVESFWLHVNTIIYPFLPIFDATAARPSRARALTSPTTRLAACQPPSPQVSLPSRPTVLLEGQVFTRPSKYSTGELSFLGVTSSLRSNASQDASPSFLPCARAASGAVHCTVHTRALSCFPFLCAILLFLTPSFRLCTIAFPLSRRASYIVPFRM